MDPPPRSIRPTILWALVLMPAAALAFVDPISQDPGYHEFADQRTWLGIPNASNVLTNIPFLLAGWLALRKGRRALPWRVLAVAVVAVGFGSAYYHWSPSNPTLVWDRLPMTLGFMALLVALWADHVDEGARAWLVPALAVGAGSVVYWARADDLRPYLWVQFGSLFAMLGILQLFVRRDPIRRPLGAALLLYALAKVAEVNDAEVLALTGIMSGHALKHLLAATALAVLAPAPRATCEPDGGE